VQAVDYWLEGCHWLFNGISLPIHWLFVAYSMAFHWLFNGHFIGRQGIAWKLPFNTAIHILSISVLPNVHRPEVWSSCFAHAAKILNAGAVLVLPKTSNST
jgi:hypothetical protein